MTQTATGVINPAPTAMKGFCMSDPSDTHHTHIDASTAIALVITLLPWASAFAGIRAGLDSYSPGALVLFRFLVASAGLIIYALITHMHLPALRDLPAIFFMGFAGITVYQVCLTFGEQTVAAGTASFLVATVPCFTVLLAFFFLKERLSLLGTLGIIVSFIGVAIISFSGKSGLSFTPGTLLIVLASFSESIAFILQKRFMHKYTGLELATYMIWTGTIFMLVFAPELLRQLPHTTLIPTLSIVYLGIFPAAISYVAWSYTLSRIPASTATSFLNLSPVLALFISWLWLHEVPVLLEIVGGVVVIIGVLIVNTRGKA
jgi:drug/metabolite transporter (DMT)-like permease